MPNKEAEELHVKIIKECVHNLRSKYKSGLQGDFEWSADTFRVRRLYRKGGTLIDLGGGISAHNGVLAQLGMTVYVIDMLDEYWEHKATAPADISQEIQLLKARGVRFIPGEISMYDLRRDFAESSIDVVTSFHCIEHLHRSPRLVLESGMHILKAGGTMLIEVPNAANARKRLALLCGGTNYGPYNSFYYNEPFVGHVREYTVGDLRQLAQNLGASTYRIFGQNNTVYGKWVETIPSLMRRLLNRVLQAFPGLCSSILLEITKT
jgi:2-polyprenyl-3-methyl-5-hydroxy-6-metoxy-1,4-benzoquinol methylase